MTRYIYYHIYIHSRVSLEAILYGTIFFLSWRKNKITETSHRGGIPQPLRALRLHIVDYCVQHCMYVWTLVTCLFSSMLHCLLGRCVSVYCLSLSLPRPESIAVAVSACTLLLQDRRVAVPPWPSSRQHLLYSFLSKCTQHIATAMGWEFSSMNPCLGHTDWTARDIEIKQ